MPRAAGVIVAAGEGSRMGSKVRKQYLGLGGMPILAWSIRAFSASPSVSELVLVIPEADFAYCRQKVLARLGIEKPVRMAAGGTCRQESVYNGLAALSGEEGLVLIHDGVRPFVSAAQIEAAVRAAAAERACTLGIRVSDTVKQATDTGHVAATLERKALWLAQTPQAFDLSLIRQAHEKAREAGYQGTDDASLVESAGGRVRILPGSPWNIKITTAEDLRLAEMMLQSGLFHD